MMLLQTAALAAIASAATAAINFDSFNTASKPNKNPFTSQMGIGPYKVVKWTGDGAKHSKSL